MGRGVPTVPGGKGVGKVEGGKMGVGKTVGREIGGTLMGKGVAMIGGTTVIGSDTVMGCVGTLTGGTEVTGAFPVEV